MGHPPAGVDLGAVAAGVSYVGSPEHKDTPSFAGWPKPRHGDAGICDRSLRDSKAEITRWLQDGIRAGSFSALWDGAFPHYVWRREGEIVYEGRLTNRGKGEYKGYPLRRDEWPDGLG